MANCNRVASRYPAPIWYQSRPLTLTDGGANKPFDLSFLKAARDQMAHPRITKLKLRFTLTNVQVDNGPFPGSRLAYLLRQIMIKDTHSVRYDLTGRSHKEVEFIETLNPQTSVDVADNDDVEFFLHIPVVPRDVMAPSQYRWELDEFLGGQFQLGFASLPVLASAAGDTPAQITDYDDGAAVELWAEVVDEGKDESKIRTVWRDFPITNSYDNYPAPGRLRYFLQDIGMLAAEADVWASQDISSRVIELNSVPDTILRDDYLQQIAPVRDRPDVAVDSDDDVVTGKVLPMFMRRPMHPITELPECGQVDWKTTLVLGSGTFDPDSLPTNIVSWIEDRRPCSDERDGVVKTADGKSVPTAEVAPDLRHKLAVVPG